MATITTGITQLTDDGPVYRGRRAVDLATTWSFEAVAELLWRGDDAVPDWTPVELDPPPTLGSSDRMRWAVVLAGAEDPLRADLRPEVVRRRAPRLGASMVAVLPLPTPGTPRPRRPHPSPLDGRAPGRGAVPGRGPGRGAVGSTRRWS